MISYNRTGDVIRSGLFIQLKEATNSQENKLIVDMLRHADRAVKKLFESTVINR